MSYDVTLFIPAGDAPLEEQVDDDEPKGEPTDEDRARLAAIRASLVAYDPAAKFEEGEHGALILVDGAKLPYLEIGPRRAGMHMSMGNDPRDVYECLQAVTGLFAPHGFVAYDYQQGAIVKPNADFRAFMQQFRSQWDKPADFEAWLAKASASTSTSASAPAKKSGSSALGIGFGLLILLWALYKLHKAGYF